MSADSKPKTNIQPSSSSSSSSWWSVHKWHMIIGVVVGIVLIVLIVVGSVVLSENFRDDDDQNHENSPVLPDSLDFMSSTIVLSPTVTLQVTKDGNETQSYVLTFDKEAWVALVASPDGAMVGSQAVMGFPDSAVQYPQIYNLMQHKASGVVLSETQILMSSCIRQDRGKTELSFTVPLETDGFYVPRDQDMGYMYAVGFGNTMGKHFSKGRFVLDGRTNSIVSP